MERIPRLTLYDLTERELLILRQEVDMRRKSMAAVWILWVCLGFIGAHRFYLGRIGTGIAMLVTIGGVLVWWILDAFLVPGMLKANQWQVQAKVLEEIALMREKGASKPG